MYILKSGVRFLYIAEMKKFKNIQDYFTFVSSVKKPEIDPYDEEQWDDFGNVRITDSELNGFIDYVVRNVRENSRDNVAPNKTLINNIVLNNKDIMLRYHDIMKFLDDNFYMDNSDKAKGLLHKTGRSKWIPKRDFIIEKNLDLHRIGGYFRKGRSYSGITKLGDILEKELNINVDYDTNDDTYVIYGNMISAFWMLKKVWERPSEFWWNFKENTTD